MIPSSIKSKINTPFGKDALWTLLGQIIIMLCLLIINKIISNEFSVSDYGRYNIIKRSSAVLTFVLLGGMGIALPRYLAIALIKKKIKEIKVTLFSSIIYIVLVCIVTLIVYAICKPYICIIVTGSNSWYDYLIIFFYSIISCISSYLVAYYRGLDRFKEFNLIQIILQISVLIPLFFKIPNIIDIFVWWSLIQLILLIIFSIKEIISYKKIFNIIIPLKFYAERTKELSYYSLPRLIGDFILFAMSAFPLIYIGERLSMTEVSYFSVSITLFTLSTPIFSFFGVILLPYVSRLIADNKAEEAKQLVSKLQKYYISLAILINIVMFIFMKWMILIFFSPDYFPAITPSRIISLSLVPAALYYLYRNPLDAISVKPYNTYILSICFVLLVIGFLYAKSLDQFAYIYLGVYTFQGCVSWLVWKSMINSKTHSQQIE